MLAATGARLRAGAPERVLRGVSTDTRTLRHGDLFVALEGASFDGQRFAAEALRRGAAGILTRERLELDPGALGDAVLFEHASPRRALGELAAWHRRRLRARVVGVTGSCGKTTTKNMLVELLSGTCRASGSPASYNNDVGVPLTLFGTDEDVDVAVVEIGTNRPGEIASLCRIAAPDAGLVTNIGAGHLAGLGSLEGVASEKSALPASLPPDGFCVLNAASAHLERLRDASAARVITFSVRGNGDLDARDVWFHAGGTTFRLGEREITSPLLGQHNVENLLAALAACQGLGVDLEAVLPAIGRLRASPGRLERVEIEGMTFFDDTYNANPDSARASVRVLAGLHGYARRVLVLGDMLELGEASAELHAEAGRLVAESGIDLFVTVGPKARAALEGALAAGLPASRALGFATVDEALGALPGMLGEGDVVLAKASRATGLERLVGALRQARTAAEAAGAR